jgi:nucleoside-diphosphate-sugar epimerase
VSILVTGAAGFIGTHLCRELREHGYEVIAVDRADGDLLLPGMMRTFLEDHGPECVVHLAAKVGRLFGEVDLLETVMSNAGMTALVANACGEAGVSLVYASSSEVYGNGSERTWHESDLHRADPHNVYGLSKRWGEDLCNLYAPENLTILRLSMPYGPGHPPGSGRAALTQFLDCAMRWEPLSVHRNSERSWCWVGDTVRGIRLIIESGQGGAWNVGRDDNALPLRTVAEMACDLVGAPRSLIQEVEAPNRQTVVKRLATSKLRGLGWKPEVELEDGMQMTLEWLQERMAAAA